MCKIFSVLKHSQQSETKGHNVSMDLTESHNRMQKYTRCFLLYFRAVGGGGGGGGWIRVYSVTSCTFNNKAVQLCLQSIKDPDIPLF